MSIQKISLPLPLLLFFVSGIFKDYFMEKKKDYAQKRDRDVGG